MAETSRLQFPSFRFFIFETFVFDLEIGFTLLRVPRPVARDLARTIAILLESVGAGEWRANTHSSVGLRFIAASWGCHVDEAELKLSPTDALVHRQLTKKFHDDAEETFRTANAAHRWPARLRYPRPLQQTRERLRHPNPFGPNRGRRSLR